MLLAIEILIACPLHFYLQFLFTRELLVYSRSSRPTQYTSHCHSRPGGFGTLLRSTLNNLYIYVRAVVVIIIIIFIIIIFNFSNLRTPLPFPGLLPDALPLLLLVFVFHLLFPLFLIPFPLATGPPELLLLRLDARMAGRACN